MEISTCKINKDTQALFRFPTACFSQKTYHQMKLQPMQYVLIEYFLHNQSTTYCNRQFSIPMSFHRCQFFYKALNPKLFGTVFSPCPAGPGSHSVFLPSSRAGQESQKAFPDAQLNAAHVPLSQHSRLSSPSSELPAHTASYPSCSTQPIRPYQGTRAGRKLRSHHPQTHTGATAEWRCPCCLVIPQGTNTGRGIHPNLRLFPQSNNKFPHL